MSQADLARRSGVSKPIIVRFEAGRGDFQLGTIKRLFEAVFCDLLVLPKARKRPSDAIAERELERYVGQRPWDEPPPDATQKLESAIERVRRYHLRLPVARPAGYTRRSK